MGDNERRTRLQAATDLSQRATALFGLDEMQGQETRPCIERTIRRAIDEAIQEMGASSMKDMGKVMKGARERLAGRTADGARVSQMVKEKLS